MILKATVKCSCGCSYEMVSCKEHELVKCPNCSKVFSESDKLIDIFKIFNSINLEKDNYDSFASLFQKESITLSTIDDQDTACYEIGNNN